jgi:hypothetical protein
VDLKSFDTTLLKKLMDPKAAGDLNIFLEKLPHHAGQTVLIAAGIAWAMAAALGLYASVEAKSLTELREQLKETKALQPTVPVIKDVPIDTKEVEAFVTELKDIYRGLTIQASGSTINITAATTSRFTEFREAVGHVQNGGSGWRVTMEKLCVGRECDRVKLAAALKINKVSVEKAQ